MTQIPRELCSLGHLHMRTTELVDWVSAKALHFSCALGRTPSQEIEKTKVRTRYFFPFRAMHRPRNRTTFQESIDATRGGARTSTIDRWADDKGGICIVYAQDS